MKRFVLAAIAIGCSPSQHSAPAPAAAGSGALEVRSTTRVDLASYGVVADDPDKASGNRGAIQRAIDDNAGKHAALVLPRGKIYVDQGEYYDSIRFGPGASDLELVGYGPDATTIVIQGDARGGLWLGIEVIDGARRIQLHDFAIQHGTIANRSKTQQDHLIQLNAQRANTGDIELWNVAFGPCVGDALRIAGSAPYAVEHVKLHDFTMQTNGQPQSPKALSRSGLSLQRGFRDVEVYNFRIAGARGSPIDMEPTGNDAMDKLVIHDGVVDNSLGDTVYAVSLGGYEDKEHKVTPLSNSSFHDVVILEGQLNILNSSGLVVQDVVLYASANGPMANAPEPLVYVFHDNQNLKLLRVNMLRDRGAGRGPLVLVTHGTDTYPSNIEIDGGTWISRVDPVGKPPFLVSFESAQHVRMENVVLRAELDHPLGKYAIKLRSSARDIKAIRFGNLRIESPNGKLTAGIWLAATNQHAIDDIQIKNVKAPDVAATGVLFDAADGSSIERSPVLEGNDFGANPWGTLHSAAVTPRGIR